MGKSSRKRKPNIEAEETEEMDETPESSQASDVEGSTPISVVHVTIPSSALQVQSVIQANQPSVIQTVGGTIQTIQVTPVGDGDGAHEDEESKKRRELLERRPSYRKILNELSVQPESQLALTKIEEESNDSLDEDEREVAASLSTSNATIVPGQTIQIAAHGDAGVQGLQTLTMSNSSQAANAGATIVQYAQGPDGQFLIPVSQLAGNVQYQIAPTTLAQNVVMASAGGGISSTANVTEEASRKRELRLLKNREAARECRHKKKQYVKCLENRVSVLETQNKTLIEELKSLKELYCQKEAQS